MLDCHGVTLQPPGERGKRQAEEPGRGSGAGGDQWEGPWCPCHMHAAPAIGGGIASITYWALAMARAAGEVHHAGELLPLAGLRLLAVERDDRGEDVRDPLRRVELTGLLARASGELADQVLIGVAEGVAVRGELREALGYLGDDRAERSG